MDMVQLCDYPAANNISLADKGEIHPFQNRTQKHNKRRPGCIILKTSYPAGLIPTDQYCLYIFYELNVYLRKSTMSLNSYALVIVMVIVRVSVVHIKVFITII